MGTEGEDNEFQGQGGKPGATSESSREIMHPQSLRRQASVPPHKREDLSLDPPVRRRITFRRNRSVRDEVQQNGDGLCESE